MEAELVSEIHIGTNSSMIPVPNLELGGCKKNNLASILIQDSTVHCHSRLLFNLCSLFRNSYCLWRWFTRNDEWRSVVVCVHDSFPDF